MQNTEFNIDMLSSMTSSDNALDALIGMINDMGLEIEDVNQI